MVGVYVTVPLLSETVPCVLPVDVTAVTVSVCATSFAGPVLSFVVRSAAGNVRTLLPVTFLLSSVADGVSFTSRTVIVTVAVFEFAVPSFTRYVKLSLPL